MKNLEAFALVKEILNHMQAGKRQQVRREKLADVKIMLSSLITRYELKPKMTIIIEDVFLAVSSAEETNLIVVPEDMKVSIVNAIESLKFEIAKTLLCEFETKAFTFEVGDTVFNLLREAVATETGGDMTDEY